MHLSKMSYHINRDSGLVPKLHMLLNCHVSYIPSLLSLPMSSLVSLSCLTCISFIVLHWLTGASAEHLCTCPYHLNLDSFIFVRLPFSLFYNFTHLFHILLCPTDYKKTLNTFFSSTNLNPGLYTIIAFSLLFSLTSCHYLHFLPH